MSLEQTDEQAFDRRYEAVAQALLDKGIKPNHITLLQIPVFLGMIWSAGTGQAWWFFSLSWLVIVLDGGDGILARVGNLQSKSGAALDAGMDTIGIAIVLWGASQFHPDLATWFLVLFLLNVALYLQNELVHEKVVSYVRGPIILGIVVPDVVLAALGMTLLITVFLIVMRLRPAPRPVGGV